MQAAFDSGALFSPSEGVADTPTGLYGSADYQNGLSSFYADWNPVPGALTYTVQINSDSEPSVVRSFYANEANLVASYRPAPGKAPAFDFRVRAETADGLSAWSEPAGFLYGSNEPTSSVEPLAIRTVQPNPTRAGATVAFTLPETAEVRLDVVDLLGRTVRELADGPREAGPHELTFDASSLAAGVYVLRLRSGSEQATVRFTVVP